MFGLDGGVGDFFDVAFKFIQKGSEVLMAEEEQQGGRGFVAQRKFNFDSNIPMPRAQLRDMEAPIGMKLPNIQAAARYFATNQAKDTNINQSRTISSLSYADAGKQTPYYGHITQRLSRCRQRKKVTS